MVKFCSEMEEPSTRYLDETTPHSSKFLDGNRLQFQPVYNAQMWRSQVERGAQHGNREVGQVGCLVIQLNPSDHAVIP